MSAETDQRGPAVHRLDPRSSWWPEGWTRTVVSGTKAVAVRGIEGWGCGPVLIPQQPRIQPPTKVQDRVVELATIGGEGVSDRHQGGFGFAPVGILGNGAMEMLDVRDQVRSGLESVGAKITGSGMGMGGGDLWFVLDGVEYFLHVEKAGNKAAGCH